MRKRTLRPLPERAGSENGGSVLCKTAVFRVDPENPDAITIAQAAKAIRDGYLVAFPTETVYGIAANVLDPKAVQRLYEVKKRFRGKPFTVHIAHVGMIRRMGCVVTKSALAAMRKFWPGPLTIILKTRDGRSIGFRMPANKVALELIKASRVPVGAPSANISGRLPPRDAKGVLKDLDGLIDILIDSGPTELGIESTVADFSLRVPRVLREGAIKRSSLMALVKAMPRRK